MAYANIVAPKMCPAPSGREREVKNDPRLQKKISQLKGIEYRIPLDDVVEEEPAETQVIDAFAVETGIHTEFEEELGQATDILGELMDMNEKVPRRSVALLDPLVSRHVGRYRFGRAADHFD